MSENSKIEWCDHTFNPWIGCTRVSPGCDSCYAAVSTPARAMSIKWGSGEMRRRTADSTWQLPRKWNRRHDEFFAKHGRRQRVFCASLADVFDNEVGNGLRSELLGLIYDTPNLDWLLLTKRVGNVPRLMDECTEPSKQWELLPNVWLGATIVNQEEADRDIPKLLAINASVRFLSMEPLLGPVDLSEHLRTCCDSPIEGARGSDFQPPDPPVCCGSFECGIDWVIVGGESGALSRPMHPDWARDLRDQCQEAGVPFLFKQWGEWAPGESCGAPMTRTERTADWWDGKWMFGELTPKGSESMHHDDEPVLYRCGKKKAGRHLDGRTHDDFPQSRAAAVRKQLEPQT